MSAAGVASAAGRRCCSDTPGDGRALRARPVRPAPALPSLDSRRPGSTRFGRPAGRSTPSRSIADSDSGRTRRRSATGRPRDATDRRRLVAAILSSILPGTGQALNGRLRPALLFGVPTPRGDRVAGWLAHSDTPTMLIARLIAPSVLGILLVLNVVILVWRAIAVLQAFTDRRYPCGPGRLGAVGLAALLVVTVAAARRWPGATATRRRRCSPRSSADRPSVRFRRALPPARRGAPQRPARSASTRRPAGPRR